MFKAIEARVTAGGDRRAAAAEYEAYAEAFRSNADLALHNAGVYEAEAGQVRSAIALRERLVTRFPGSPYTPDALAALGFPHESLADFGAAAARYEQLSATAPTHRDAADAAYSAGVIRAARGEWRAALADWERYAARWPERHDVTGVRFDAARVLEEHGELAQAASAYKALFTTGEVEQSLYARLRYGLLLGRMGQRPAPHWQDTLAWYATIEAPTPGAVESAAQVSFQAAEPRFDAYLLLTMTGSTERGSSPRQVDEALKRQLLAKVEPLRALEASYAEIVSMGSGEWGIASLTRLGAAYEAFAIAIGASPIPEHLTPDQAEAYVQRRDDLIYNQQQRATASYCVAIERSHAMSLYTPASADASERLARLTPDEAPTRFERVPEARFTAPALALARVEE